MSGWSEMKCCTTIIISYKKLKLLMLMLSALVSKEDFVYQSEKVVKHRGNKLAKKKGHEVKESHKHLRLFYFSWCDQLENWWDKKERKHEIIQKVIQIISAAAGCARNIQKIFRKKSFRFWMLFNSQVANENKKTNFVSAN